MYDKDINYEITYCLIRHVNNSLGTLFHKLIADCVNRLVEITPLHEISHKR